MLGLGFRVLSDSISYYVMVKRNYTNRHHNALERVRDPCWLEAESYRKQVEARVSSL